MNNNGEAGPPKKPNPTHLLIEGYRSPAMKKSQPGRESLQYSHLQSVPSATSTQIRARTQTESYPDESDPFTFTHSQKRRLEQIERKQEEEDSDFSIHSNDKPRKRSPRDDTEITPKPTHKKPRQTPVTPLSKKKIKRPPSVAQQQLSFPPIRPVAGANDTTPSRSTSSTEVPNSIPTEHDIIADDGTQDRAETFVGMMAEAHDPPTRSESSAPSGRQAQDSADPSLPVHRRIKDGTEAPPDRHGPTSVRSHSANAGDDDGMFEGGAAEGEEEDEEAAETEDEAEKDRPSDRVADHDDGDALMLATPSSPLARPPPAFDAGRLAALVAGWMDRGDTETFGRVVPLIRAYFEAKAAYARAKEELEARMAGLETVLWEVGERR